MMDGYISQPVPDDADLSVRVIDSHAQSAGIILRDDTTPNGARFAATIDAHGKLTVSRRAGKGTAAQIVAQASVTLPCELRVQRDADKMTVRYRGGDGAWRQCPPASWGVAGASIRAGLWVAGGSACLADWDALLRGKSTPFAGNLNDADMLIDLVKTAYRPFYRCDNDQSVALDAHGWPMDDFRFTMCESLGLPNRAVFDGTYTLVWERADNALVSNSGSIS